MNVASMRPRHICRGNAVDGSSQRENIKRFNEAAAYLPREPAPQSRHCPAAAAAARFNEAAAYLPRERERLLEVADAIEALQ